MSPKLFAQMAELVDALDSKSSSGNRVWVRFPLWAQKNLSFMMHNQTKQHRYDQAYMKMAIEWGKLSYCNRKQVGALIVKDNMIISDGYNGTPSGFENTCELENGETKWYVLHAEANAILKCAKHGQSSENASLYLTHSPCKNCSKLIHQAGIKRVVYHKEYKDLSGVDFLLQAKVEIVQLKELI